ncbi:PRC-barrel domain-containing protein [Robertmurraya korlensis]|uniref:PRC-barrel domain-containing protein n=1 Tax=Robertmurraya korlensis TaxID=519977 RepID=UPI00203C0B55|nr:PRC-barrel domain-containing protein [Robertmurraya korlensis]MCM3599472.1 PRC-barrel domain-containing protein [Robertmurraya korlensis]
MRTFTLLKGVSVYEKESGSKVGEVNDLIISATSDSVQSLLVKQGMLVKRTALLDIQDVTSFGSDGVMIENRTLLRPINRGNHSSIAFCRGLSGNMLLSSDGEQLGLIEDVYFKEELGTIVGYQCSDGFFSDIKEGKRVIKTDEPLQYGKDAIIVNVKKS